MLALENADEILQILDRFTKQKSKDIPPELEEYISYVAKTGDTVYRWPTVQYLFREKLRNVIKDFHDTTASIEDLPQCPNVDQFNYESMKTLLFERFDNFQAAPFTVQRLCELLTDPKKHYSRLDKFMRALEKNILVVSTVEPGRKPLENDDSDHLAPNGDILSDISNEIEITKNENKLSTNGNTDKHNDCNASEALAKAEVAIDSTSNDNVPSSSGTSTVTATEVDAKEAEAETKDALDQVAVEKPIESATQQSATVTSAEPQTTNDEKMDEQVEASADETVEAKPTEPMAEDVTDKQEAEIDTTTPEKPELKVVPKKVEDKTDDIEIDSESQIKSEVTNGSSVVPSAATTEEKPVDEAKEAVPMVEAVKRTPPTPKHARSASDEEDGGDNNGDGIKNPCAKKIRLDLNASEIEKPEIDSKIAPAEDLQKEAELLDSLSTEIDAQKEKELLEEVDSTLDVAKQPINIDVKPIAESVAIDAEAVSKPVEDTPTTTSDLLKTDAPVASPSDLDFTPDEALNELVSSDILAVIPEQPTEEAKMNDEPVNVIESTEPAPVPATPVEIVVPAAVVADAEVAVATAAADEMNVESSETSNLEVENAMEAAPIKADEEKMDVDESNSVDAMDL